MPFQPSLIFVYKNTYLNEAEFKCRLLALPTNIRLVWKGLIGTNYLAYYEYQ